MWKSIDISIGGGVYFFQIILALARENKEIFMKKKLVMILLVVVMILSLTTVLVACGEEDNGNDTPPVTDPDNGPGEDTDSGDGTGNGTGNGSNSGNGSGNGTIVGSTVTETEWQSILTALTTTNCQCDMTVEAMSMAMILKQYNGTLYIAQVDGDDVGNELYATKDDATQTIVLYEKEEGTWEKETTVYDNATEYAQSKLTYNIVSGSALGNYFYLEAAGADEGPGKTLDELYSAFTYDATTETYTATLYVINGRLYNEETGESVYQYAEMTIGLKFQDGVVVGGSLTQEQMTMSITFSYEVSEIVIPAEVLSAPEASPGGNVEAEGPVENPDKGESDIDISGIEHFTEATNISVAVAVLERDGYSISQVLESGVLLSAFPNSLGIVNASKGSTTLFAILFDSVSSATSYMNESSDSDLIQVGSWVYMEAVAE